MVAEHGDTAQQVIDRCWELEAIRDVDGIEFCVQLRPEVGPELWSERALRRSLVCLAEQAADLRGGPPSKPCSCPPGGVSGDCHEHESPEVVW